MGKAAKHLGNIFQISNQITLGKSEEDIIDDLKVLSIKLLHRKDRHGKH